MVQIASMPVSPVRMRMASSTSETKILPSPMRPVWAALRIASTALLDHVVAEHDFHFYFWQKVDDVLRAAIEFGMPLLATESLCLGDRDSLESGFLKRFLHLVELEGFYDRFDLLHGCGISKAGSVAGRQVAPRAAAMTAHSMPADVRSVDAELSRETLRRTMVLPATNVKSGDYELCI